MMSLAYVAAGGAFGAVLRYLLGKGMVQMLGHGFPYGTLCANILGSLVMGLFVGQMAKMSETHTAMHLFVAIGLLGGFTTFSSFSLDTVTLVQRGEMASAAVYILSSVVVSITALFAGLYLMRQF